VIDHFVLNALNSLLGVGVAEAAVTFLKIVSVEEMKFLSSEISGMGGSYEEGCQLMLYLGLQWIKDKPLDIWKGTYSYKNIYGVLFTGNGLKELEDIWDKDPFLDEYGYTGAMHQAVMGHLAYIHKHSFKQWLDEKEKGGTKPKIYEIPDRAEKK
jgi:hypothetical protein